MKANCCRCNNIKDFFSKKRTAKSNSMKRYDWKITIKTIIRSMRLLGLWPAGDESYKLNFYSLYSAFVLIVLNWGHVFFQTANIFFTFDDLEAVTGMLYITLSEFLVSLKAYFVMKNMSTLKELMVILNSDFFQPRNSKQLDLIKPDVKFWSFNSKVFWVSVLMAVFFWSTYPIFDNSIHNRRLPFLAWYPYKTEISPLYEITYIYQCFGITVNGCTAVCIDGLNAAIYMYIGAQFDILCDDVKHIFDSEEDEEAVVMQKLVKCIQHHQTIVQFYQNSRKFSDWIVFGQFFISTLAVGITMFMLTMVEPLSSEFFALFAYLAACLIQIFQYCWFGNNVELKSSRIPYALFSSNWLNTSKKLKQVMIVFIERTRRPLKVTALKLFYLNLDTFMRILRAGWSYFALLNRVNGRQVS